MSSGGQLRDAPLVALVAFGRLGLKPGLGLAQPGQPAAGAG
jgi:hypothetical protein